MTKIAEIWKEAAADLGLEIIAPFSLEMPDKTKIDFEVLLKNFGAEHGILLVDTLSKLKGYFSVIPSLGYGCSVVSPYPEDYVYNREEVIEVLSDWTWTGPASQKPRWLYATGSK